MSMLKKIDWKNLILDFVMILLGSVFYAAL